MQKIKPIVCAFAICAFDASCGSRVPADAGQFFPRDAGAEVAVVQPDSAPQPEDSAKSSDAGPSSAYDQAFLGDGVSPPVDAVGQQDLAFPDLPVTETFTAETLPVDSAPDACVSMKLSIGDYISMAVQPYDGSVRDNLTINFYLTKDGNIPTIRFSPDNYLYDAFPVICNSFEYVHGWSSDGTDCPTDGYKISGTFVSSWEIRGHYESTSNCQVDNQEDFTATLIIQ